MEAATLASQNNDVTKQQNVGCVHVTDELVPGVGLVWLCRQHTGSVHRQQQHSTTSWRTLLVWSVCSASGEEKPHCRRLPPAGVAGSGPPQRPRSGSRSLLRKLLSHLFFGHKTTPCNTQVRSAASLGWSQTCISTQGSSCYSRPNRFHENIYFCVEKTNQIAPIT